MTSPSGQKNVTSTGSDLCTERVRSGMLSSRPCISGLSRNWKNRLKQQEKGGKERRRLLSTETPDGIRRLMGCEQEDTSCNRNPETARFYEGKGKAISEGKRDTQVRSARGSHGDPRRRAITWGGTEKRWKRQNRAEDAPEIAAMRETS